MAIVEGSDQENKFDQKSELYKVELLIRIIIILLVDMNVCNFGNFITI